MRARLLPAGAAVRGWWGLSSSGTGFGERRPYAFAARRYLELGWNPLPVRGKHLGLPSGFTGREGIDVEERDAERWIEARGDDNICLRMPAGVIGVDVDGYGEKKGRETLSALEGARGELPLTFAAGSREDEVSGIRFFRVPAGTELPAIMGPGIEVIQRHHRYAVAWPSVHPDTGRQYRWRRVPGWEECAPPAAGELPELPAEWLSDWSAAVSGAAASDGGSGGGDAVDIAWMIKNGAGESGTQHGNLLRLTMKLAGQGRSEEEALLIWDAVIASTSQDPSQPWTRDDFRVLFLSGQAKASQSELLRQHTVTEQQREWARQETQRNAATLLSGSDNGGGDSGNDDGEGGDAGGGGGSFQPDDYIIPPGYHIRVEDDGSGSVIWERPSGNRTTPVIISHRPLLVSGMARAVDGEESWYTIRWLDTRGQNREAVISANDIAGSSKLLQLGDLVTSKSNVNAVGKYLGELTTENAAWLEAHCEIVAAQLGWQGQGMTEFAFGPGRPHRVPDTRNAKRWIDSHGTSGTLDGWREAAWKCAGQRIALAMLSASLAPALLRATGARPFVAGVDGSTTGGKTTSMRLCASVWGYPEEGYLIRSWDDTGVSNEQRASMLRGLPLFLDETQHAAGTQKVPALIYAMSAGHSRGRSNQQGTALIGDVAFETIVITSGEKSLTSFTGHGGVLPRVVTMNGKPMASAQMADEVKRIVLANYGVAGEAWLEIIMMMSLSELTHRYLDIEEQLRKAAANPIQGRRASSVALMQLSAEIAFTSELMPAAPADTWPWLVNGGSSLDEHDDDPPLKALMLLANMVTSNSRLFWNGKRGPGIMDGIYLTEPPNGWAGRYQAGDYLSVRPEWLREALERHDIDWDAVKGAWRERGWLRTPPPDSTRATAMTVSERLPTGNATCVRIICQELLDVLSTGMIE